MSLIQYSTPGQVIPQADFEASISDNGLWTGSQSFLIRKGSLDSPSMRANFAIGRQITSLDPNADSFWSFLRIHRITPSTDVGGWTRLNVHLQGFFSDGGGDGEEEGIISDDFVTYSMRGETSDAPISEHPKFKGLGVNEQIALGQLMSGVYVWRVSNPEASVGDFEFQLYYASDLEQEIEVVPQLTSVNAKKFAELIASGAMSYRRAGYTWTKRWSSEVKMTPAQLNKLGKIANPPGSPPTPTGGRDYMLVSAGFEQTGNITAIPTYTNELVFELSDSDGFDQFLYTDD